MTRRTREAMVSELKLPQHYVELDSQEMMYVDGGAVYTGWNALAIIGYFAGMTIGGITEALLGIGIAVGGAPSIITIPAGIYMLLTGLFKTCFNSGYALIAAVTFFKSWSSHGNFNSAGFNWTTDSYLWGLLKIHRFSAV